MEAFKKSINEVLTLLNVVPEKGLTDEEVLKSSEEHGQNVFSKKKGKSIFVKILDSLKEPMLIMLIIAALIALSVNVVNYIKTGHQEFIEVVGIFIAIILSISITLIMEGKSEKAFEALNKIKDDIKVKCVRNGKSIYVSQAELVVGDIINIETGDKIPADARLLSSISLEVDESALTGESFTVKKDENEVFTDNKTPVAERVNMIYSGSFVTGGSGVAVVTEVGYATEFGKIANELRVENDTTTPIQEKLARLGKLIAIIGVSAAALVFIIQVVGFIIKGSVSFETISTAFITSIILIVASVPEGLPTIVAVSLAINIIKLAKQNALVKKMVASETIGCINVICSDKTGTLTENKMSVIEVYADKKFQMPEVFTNSYLKKNFCVNSTANIEIKDNKTSFVGNPTECALLVAYSKSEKYQKNYLDVRNSEKIDFSYPFSSETKNMTTVLKNSSSYEVYTKGSPEKILSFCDKVSINDIEEPLTPDFIKEIENGIIEYQKRSYRVIGFAHKVYTDEVNYEKDRKLVESKMVFDGFVAIADPLRKDVFDAVKNAQCAGIDIKILTGDNIVTATAIATELNLIDESHIAVVARDLEDLTEDELIKLLPKIRVIARSTPIIKMRVVQALKKIGNVVAVTGDGINDAPAIKNADVGIAMGISGTEVSKEASDIVLLDDSFSTIIRAVHWGRGIYENFMRFIQFQLTVNLSSVVVVLSSVVMGFASPFTALQLLWINLIMDGPPALTLGLEPIRADLMKQKPVLRNANILSKNMIENIVINGLYIATIFLVQSKTNFMQIPAEQINSALFTMFVLFQLFNAFNSKELGNRLIIINLFKNKIMLVAIFCTFVLQFIITQYCGSVFKTVALDIVTWGKILGASFSIIILSEIVKFIRFLLTLIFKKQN